MIKTEIITNSMRTIDIIKTYSDSGFQIRQVQTGNIYVAAYDRIGQLFDYEETDQLIERVDKTESDMRSDLETLKISTTKIDI